MRYLGIDYGGKKVGLALSDEQDNFAYPLAVIANNAKLFDQIKTICEKEGVGKIVLGESLNYHRRRNPIMRSILKFKRQLETGLGLAVALEDEVLTTKEASRTIGVDKLLDARAAAIILKSYLDRQL